MSLSSTSSSDGWRRLRRDALRVFIILLLLEVALRIGPVHEWAASHLDSYENLLWYDGYLPSYQKQILAGERADLWLVGSSYMMTSLQPQWIQDSLRQHGLAGITVQNYGVTQMTNLKVMSQLFDRWLFRLAQPRYLLLAVAEPNFTEAAGGRARVQDSPFERTFIFQQTPGDYVANFLYSHSNLYRYAILARNASFIPYEQTIRPSLPLGGYTERERTLNCQPRPVTDAVPPNDLDWMGGFERLDAFLDVAAQWSIPVAVMDIPAPLCSLQSVGFNSFETYRQLYLDRLRNHLAARGVRFYELDSRFHTIIDPSEQNQYFDDARHANRRGAELLSAWATEDIAAWLGRKEPKS
jgi:hypothetical protein